MNKQETRTAGCIVPIIKKQCSPNENESRRDEIIVENKTITPKGEMIIGVR